MSALSDDLGERINDARGSPGPEGVWFLFCDGHARKLPYNTPNKLIAATVAPNGGDAVDLD